MRYILLTKPLRLSRKEENMRTKSTRSKFSTLKQVCELIPGHLVAKLARKHGVDEQARTFTPWSHVVALLYAQLAHATGLNNVCDVLRLHKGKLSTIRGATPPARIPSLTPTRSARPKWRKTYSGRCSITSRQSVHPLAAKPTKDFSGASNA